MVIFQVWMPYFGKVGLTGNRFRNFGELHLPLMEGIFDVTANFPETQSANLVSTLRQKITFTYTHHTHYYYRFALP